MGTGRNSNCTGNQVTRFNSAKPFDVQFLAPFSILCLLAIFCPAITDGHDHRAAPGLLQDGLDVGLVTVCQGKCEHLHVVVGVVAQSQTSS